jgi:hypothetical protein
MCHVQSDFCIAAPSYCSTVNVKRQCHENTLRVEVMYTKYCVLQFHITCTVLEYLVHALDSNTVQVTYISENNREVPCASLPGSLEVYIYPCTEFYVLLVVLWTGSSASTKACCREEGTAPDIRSPCPIKKTPRYFIKSTFKSAFQIVEWLAITA